jgi:hypothetical protein
MTNFFYSAHERKNYNKFGYRRFWSFGKDYGGFNNTDCDDCHDVYDRMELCYITTESEYNNPDNVTWTVKLCSGCLNVIIYDQDERNFYRKKLNVR